MLLRPATLAGRLLARQAGRVGGAASAGVAAPPPRMPRLAAAAATTDPPSPHPPQPDVLTATARAVPGPLADGLADALLAYGALSAAVEEDRGGGGDGALKPETPLFGPDRSGGRVWPACTVTAVFPVGTDVGAVTAAAAAAAGAGAEGGGMAWAVAASAAADWMGALHGDFRPFCVHGGGRGGGGSGGGVPLWIIPAWCEAPAEAAGAVSVRLTPGLAFGTGDHPTTRACLAWLAGGGAVVGGQGGTHSSSAAAAAASPLPGLAGGRILDYGAGSGVLAVAALALGARSAVATDVDALAARAAAENADLNGFGGRLASLLVAGDGGPGDAAAVGLRDGTAGYDVVVANILQGPLLRLAPLLAAAAAPGGRLALAGILRSQAPPLVAALEAGGVEGVGVHDAGGGSGGGGGDDGWVLVTGRKGREGRGQ